MYVEFETQQREVVIWLDNAEDVLAELDRLQADSEPSDDDVNKFKVKQLTRVAFIMHFCSLCYKLTPLC